MFSAISAAQEKPTASAEPLYPLPRYNEDWTFLRHPENRHDFWDPIKLIPLSQDQNVFLSLGGEIREAYERFHNTNFGLSPQDPDGYLLQRYLLHTDVHLRSHFRFFGELSSSVENGRAGGPRPVVDEDKLDVHQAFVSFVVAKPAQDSSGTLRVGRQEIALGSGRLVALREGTNVPLSFDGARISLRWHAWNVDGFATRPVQNQPGIFDDPPQRDFTFWGVYASHPLSTNHKAPKVDIYYLGIDRKRAVYDQGVAREKRHTTGLRLWTNAGPWSYDVEAIYQFGQFGSGSIDAWRIAADNAYSFSNLRWHPRFGFGVDVTSGDRNPSTANLQTFNALFQSGTYSGRAQILGPDNTIRAEPSVGLRLSEHITCSAGWGFYWRESLHDGLYGIAGNLIVPNNGVKDRYEGSRPLAELDWQITRHLSAHVNYIYVFNGHFEEQSVHGTPSMNYVSPWISYRF